jgi:uncharacterized YccA/Bax inhibitor family protein
MIMRIRGRNPVYKYAERNGYYDDSSTYTASISGVVMKTTYLLTIVALFALYFAYRLNLESFQMGNAIVIAIIAPIVALIAVIVTHVKPEIGLFTTLIYAGAEGTFIGFISAIFAYAYGGEIIQMALVGTFSVLAGMLFLYSTGIIRVTSFFRKLLMSALVGLLLSSLMLLILSFTGISAGTFSGLYIGIVVLSVVISSLFLLYDFDLITRYVDGGAPKSTEWSLSLGLVVTIVWLYLELLRLFAIIAGRRD